MGSSLPNHDGPRGVRLGRNVTGEGFVITLFACLYAVYPPMVIHVRNQFVRCRLPNFKTNNRTPVLFCQV